MMKPVKQLPSYYSVTVADSYKLLQKCELQEKIFDY